MENLPCKCLKLIRLGPLVWLICYNVFKFLMVCSEKSLSRLVIISGKCSDIISFRKFTSGNSGIEVILNLLKCPSHEWSQSDGALSVLKPILMRLCAR